MIDYSTVTQKMIRGSAVICLMCWSVASSANMNDDMTAYRTQSTYQTSAIPSSMMSSLNLKSSQTQSAHKTLIDSLLQNSKKGIQGKQKPQGAEGAILFVSFSMSDELLFALADEAAQFHIPVVINGLVEGDFKKTIETFKRLHREAKKQHLNFKGISIDPVWFSQFQITSVPALVVTQPPKACPQNDACANQAFDVVYGNASIKNGLELIAQKGDAAPHLARTILENGHV